MAPPYPVGSGCDQTPGSCRSSVEVHIDDFAPRLRADIHHRRPVSARAAPALLIIKSTRPISASTRTDSASTDAISEMSLTTAGPGGRGRALPRRLMTSRQPADFSPQDNPGAAAAGHHHIAAGCGQGPGDTPGRYCAFARRRYHGNLALKASQRHAHLIFHFAGRNSPKWQAFINIVIGPRQASPYSAW